MNRGVKSFVRGALVSAMVTLCGLIVLVGAPAEAQSGGTEATPSKRCSSPCPQILCGGTKGCDCKDNVCTQKIVPVD